MKKIIIANWKTYLTSAQTIALGKYLTEEENVIIAPAMLYLALMKEHFPHLNFSSQDVSSIADQYGAYTGEISAKMLGDIGVKYAIIGHSERRMNLLDNNSTIAAKLSNCMNSSITPIICVGETEEDRQSGKYLEVIEAQLVSIQSLKFERIIIAYEPIWAIGTGIIPSAEQIREIMAFIKSSLDIASNLVLVYGGSVNAENVKNILDISGIDGVLIGKASTDPAHFKLIIDITR